MTFYKKSRLYIKSIDFLQKVLTFYKKSWLFTKVLPFYKKSWLFKKSLDFLKRVLTFHKIQVFLQKVLTFYKESWLFQKVFTFYKKSWVFSKWLMYGPMNNLVTYTSFCKAHFLISLKVCDWLTDWVTLPDLERLPPLKSVYLRCICQYGEIKDIKYVTKSLYKPFSSLFVIQVEH